MSKHSKLSVIAALLLSSQAVATNSPNLPGSEPAERSDTYNSFIHRVPDLAPGFGKNVLAHESILQALKLREEVVVVKPVEVALCSGCHYN